MSWNNHSVMYVKNSVLELKQKYPLATIKYHFDRFDNDHFVCISPNDELNEIIEKEALIIDEEFINNFPDESLSFIEIDDNEFLLGMEII